MAGFISSAYLNLEITNEKQTENIIITIINFLKNLFDKKIIPKKNINKKKEALSPVR